MPASGGRVKVKRSAQTKTLTPAAPHLRAGQQVWSNGQRHAIGVEALASKGAKVAATCFGRPGFRGCFPKAFREGDPDDADHDRDQRMAVPLQVLPGTRCKLDASHEALYRILIAKAASCRGPCFSGTQLSWNAIEISFGSGSTHAPAPTATRIRGSLLRDARR